MTLSVVLVSVVALTAAASCQATPTERADTTNALFQATHPFKQLRILGFFPFNGFSHFQMFKVPQ